MTVDGPRPGAGPAPDPDASGTDSKVPALPTVAAEDNPRSWGDEPDDHDQWLREQRPPHWG